MDKKIKSPLRYPGGKFRVAKHLVPLFPDFSEYREPFVGGGSVFLETKQNFPDRKYWINDLYKPLYFLYKEMQSRPDDVIEEVYQAFISYTDGRLLHDVLKEEMHGLSPKGIASAFFILNRVTFSGTTESGGYSESAFQKRFTKSSIKRLDNIRHILNDVTITNVDYGRLLSEGDEDTFLYLDPPYYSATKSSLYGKKGSLHKNFDHERFSDLCKNSPNQWLITYDNDEYVRSLFSFADIEEVDIVYGMRNVSNNNQKSKEIIIKNY